MSLAVGAACGGSEAGEDQYGAVPKSSGGTAFHSSPSKEEYDVRDKTRS